ncbi:MAG: replicative DNA helicase [Bdellovibrio sp.]|nr:replicative DNA helicase [Bdellovibrio sp.]
MLGGDDPDGGLSDFGSFTKRDRLPSSSDRIVGRIPPHHSEAERSVLGAILLNNESIHRVLEIGLEARDFYREAHQKVFSVALALTERGEPVDLVTMTSALRDRAWFDGIGGASTLTSLFDDTFAVGNVMHYARIVRDKAILRRMIDTTAEIASQAYDGVEDTDAFLDEAERRVFNVSDSKLTKSFSSMQEILVENMHSIEELAQKSADVIGLATGFNDFDRLTSGLKSGQLIIIAARPAMGKTSLFLSMAQSIATSGKAVVAIFSLEMSKEELGFRFLSGMTRVESKKLKVGRLADRDWPRLAQAADQLSKSKIFIDDSGDLTVLDVRSRCRRLMSTEKRLDMIVVDYLQLMKGSRAAQKGDGSREREISEISRGLKSLAKELKVPIIALSQLNRGVESRPNKRPMLSDLRECVTGDTLVCLADGRRVPIRDLVGTDPDVLAMDGDGKVIAAKSDLVWSVGVKPIFKISLASGRQIRATKKHRLFSDTGWTRVGEFKVGDRIAIARAIPEPKQTRSWSDGRVALLGHLVGDGSYLVGQPMRYTTGSEECSELVKSVATREFGVEVKRYAGRGNWHQLLISGNGDRWNPKGINKWLKDLGIFGQRSHDKHLPKEVFQLDNRQVGLLLQHLWATDGTISVRKPGQKGSHGIHFSTCSEKLASDVAALLLRLGIVSRTQTVRSGKRIIVHMVWVRGSEAQTAFLDLVGAFGPRVSQAYKLRAALQGIESNTNVDTLPVAVFQRVKSLMRQQGISQRQMTAIRGTSYGGSSHFRFAPSREVIREYAEILNDDPLKKISESEIFWDRVVSIEPCGEEEVFDLTVPGPASWLADGIISHNSGAIEQDADMVCFIYRDEVYNKETQDKGIAELIVAKHRAGETDTIRLAWLPEYTLFANLSRDTPGTPIAPLRSDRGDIEL